MTIQGRRTIRVTGRRGRYLCSGKLFEITNDDFVHFHRFTLTLKYLILFYSPRIWRALESQQIAIRKLERETSAFQRKLRGIRLTVPETPGIMAPESTIFPQKTSLLDWLQSGEFTEVELRKSSSSLNTCHVHGQETFSLVYVYFTPVLWTSTLIFLINSCRAIVSQS